MDEKRANELRYERIQLFKDTVMGKETHRVPHLANVWTWKIFDAGYKMSEAMFDYDVMLNVCEHAFQKYPVDAFLDLGQRNPLKVHYALGNTAYVINDEVNSLSIGDQCIMGDDEYDAFLEDPIKYFWETALPRKYKLMAGENGSVAFSEMLKEFNGFGEYGKKVTALAASYGIPALCDGTCYPRGTAFGYETMFNNLRGIRGVSIDIRRKTEKFDAAVRKLDEMYFDPVVRDYPDSKNGSTPEAVFDGLPSMLGQTILNKKQFEKYYMPKLRILSDLAVNHDKIFYLFAEGDLTSFFDFLKELPAGHFAIHCEQADIFAMRKALPNVTLTGGMPYTLLANGTEKECVDYARRLIEELSTDGGYIFSEDKMISFRNECKAENLLAVSEFVADYTF